jgi:hypothetical protein
LSDSGLRHVAGADTRIQLQQAQGQLQNDARSTLLQAIAGLLLTVGGAATWHQVQINKDAQLTDRFSRAIEHLGNDNVDIRIGGLYELERIAKNSVADRRSVQVTIGSYLRNRAPWAAGSLDGPEHPTRANLARAWLRGTRLDGCDFHSTDLRKANLEGAGLRRASLRDAHLAGANVRDADLRDADLRGADMRADHLDSATWTGALADETTLWPDDFPRELDAVTGLSKRPNNSHREPRSGPERVNRSRSEGRA